MKKLYAPWRSSYAQSVAHTKQSTTTEKKCVFCKQLKEKNDEENFILKRFNHTVVMLNKYPYNAGHILIMPIKHIATLGKLSVAARTELMEILTKGTAIIQKTLQSDGINVGLNLGKAAGAGIPSHLHMHVLPRWFGDTNFLPLLAETKQISFDLHAVYKKLKKAF